MPLVYQQNINESTKLGIWEISENENYFEEVLPIQREIHHSHKRLQHLAGRLLLRRLFPSFPLHEILIAETRRPYLDEDPFHFSISHCDEYAAAVVSETQRVGVDIELFSQKTIAIRHKFLTLVEQHLIIDSLSGQLDECISFTIAWSVKEALYKWLATSSVDFKQHLHIESIVVKDEFEGELICSVSKNIQQQLRVGYKIFDGFVLAYTK